MKGKSFRDKCNRFSKHTDISKENRGTEVPKMISTRKRREWLEKLKWKMEEKSWRDECKRFSKHTDVSEENQERETSQIWYFKENHGAQHEENRGEDGVKM